MAQGPLVQYLGAPSYTLARRALVLARWALHVASLQLAWSREKKRAMGGFPGNLGMALGHLVHARAPGVVLLAKDPPSEILSPMGCQQIMRLGPSQVTSCSFAFASTAGPLLRPMSFPSWPPTSSYG